MPATERGLRLILANCIEQHDPADPDAESSPAKFLRSDEPLNEFYTGVIAAMRACEPAK